jgi:CRISPR-associated protein Csh1
MINAIAKLGEYVLQENPEMDILDIMLDNAFDGGKNKHLFVIVFRHDEKWRFKEIQYLELDNDYKNKILYKRGTAKGTDFTPTTKITELENKTFPNKIVNWFNQQRGNKILAEDERKILNELGESIVVQQSFIISKIKEQLDEIEDNSGKVLTIGFKNDRGGIDFIGDYEFFKRLLVEEATNDYKYSKTNKTFSFARENVCSICNNNKQEVFGFFTDLKFYNVDKPGMITGGFKHNNAWKNYPVCLDCALSIRNGYSFLRNKFDFKFYGLRYFFIPKVTDSNLYDDILDSLLSYKNQTFRYKDVQRITNDEDELFVYIEEKMSNVSFDLFFYDMPQKSVLRILMIIEDILPTRLKELFLAKQNIDNIIFFKDAKSKEDERLCYFNFGIIRNFFPNSNIEGNKDKNFIEITDKIFKGKPVDYKFILQNIMIKIRTNFVNDQSIWLYSLKGFMFILFLMNLRLIKNIEEVKVDNHFFKEFKIHTNDEFENKVELFFSSFEDFFQTDTHRSVFMLGVLAQLLLNIQKSERGAAPFRSKLKSLKMNAYDVSVLLPEIIEKLEQYDKNYYRPLEELISKLLLSAGNYKDWRLPIDELNFIFVLGMNLSKYFKIKAEEEKENQND